MDGRPIETLQKILGHSSVTVTERYAHHDPERSSKADYAAVAVDLSEPKIIDLEEAREARNA